jgi:UDP:flavonoid glycosyltransferase YjiC (YdhE family)
VSRPATPRRPLRILFTTQPAGGHLRPLVPVAQLAAQRGHDVKVCTVDRMAGELAAYGLAHLPGGYDWGPDVFGHIPRGYRHLSYPQAADVLTALDPVVTGIFAGPAARALARDVIEHARTWRPDLIVREDDEYGGYLAAEALDIPHAAIASFGGLENITGERLAPVLDEGRAELGLPADPEGKLLYRYLHATFLPRAYGECEFVLPNTRAYQHASAQHRGGRLPAWLADGDHARPFVFAGFGTVVYDLPGARDFLREVIAGLGRLDCTAVVAVGAGNSTEGLDPLPGNVRLVDFIEQALMLEGCDLFVTHGGLNSIKEALRLAVPMVGIPIGADHRHNVADCVAAGVADAVAVHEADAEHIAAACRRVLDGPGYRARARLIQRHIHALAPIDDLVDDLEELAGA